MGNSAVNSRSNLRSKGSSRLRTRGLFMAPKAAFESLQMTHEDCNNVLLVYRVAAKMAKVLQSWKMTCQTGAATFLPARVGSQFVDFVLHSKKGTRRKTGLYTINWPINLYQWHDWFTFANLRPFAWQMWPAAKWQGFRQFEPVVMGNNIFPQSDWSKNLRALRKSQVRF